MADYISVQSGEWNESSTWGTGGGGLDSYTVLLLDFEDDPFTDASDGGHTITNIGGVSRSDTESKFGTYSGYFTAGPYLYAADNEDWNFGTGDFTVDAWIYPTALTGVIFSQGAGYTDSSRFYISGNGSMSYFREKPQSTYLVSMSTGADAVTLNDWNHVALIRHGDEWRIYINGISQALDTWSGDYGNISSPCQIGTEFLGTYDYPGYIDEFRISKGIARWETDFTPPSASYGPVEYPNSTGDTATITHTVTYSISADVELGQIDIDSGGTLSFNPSANTYMEIENNTFINVTEGGWLSIGTSGAPVHKDYTAELGFNCSSDNAAGILSTGNGSISMYGDLDYFGLDKETFVANDCTGSTSITATDDMSSKWNVGDEIAIAKHEQYANWTIAGTTTTITGFDGNVIHTADAIGSDFYQDGIVVNLNRNVKIFKVGWSSGWYNTNSPGRFRIYYTNHESEKWFSGVEFIGTYYIYNMQMNYFTNPDGVFEWCVVRNGRLGPYVGYNMNLNNCVGFSLEAAFTQNMVGGNIHDLIVISSQRLIYGAQHSNIYNLYGCSNSYGLVAFYNSQVRNWEEYGSVYGAHANFGTDFVDSYICYTLYGATWTGTDRWINCGLGVDPNGVSKPSNNNWRYLYDSQEFINCLVSPSAGFAEQDDNVPAAGNAYKKFENYNRIKGDHRVFGSFGRSRTVNTDGSGSNPTQRSGGSDVISEVETYYWCGDGINPDLAVYTKNDWSTSFHNFRVFEHQLWLQADLQRTIRYYIQTDYVDLSSDKIYLGIVPMYTDSSIVSDESITTRSNQSDWSQYVEVTTTPSQDGWVRLEMIAFGYESGKYIWVDPKPEVV